MKIAIQGTRNFKKYDLFLQAMYMVLTKAKDLGHKEIVFFTAGSANINSMAIGFTNIISDSLKSHGVRARVIPLPPKEIKAKFAEIDKFLFFCNPKEPYSDLMKFFENKDPDIDPDFVTVWRF